MTSTTYVIRGTGGVHGAEGPITEEGNTVYLAVISLSNAAKFVLPTPTHTYSLSLGRVDLPPTSSKP